MFSVINELYFQLITYPVLWHVMAGLNNYKPILCPNRNYILSNTNNIVLLKFYFKSELNACNISIKVYSIVCFFYFYGCPWSLILFSAEISTANAPQMHESGIVIRLNLWTWEQRVFEQKKYQSKQWMFINFNNCF